MDVEAVAQAARRAVLAVRAGDGPVFLELRTYRFRAHSMYDPDLYRDKEEIERWKQRDPIDAYVRALTESGALDDAAPAALRDEAQAVVDDAVAFAEAGTLEPVEEMHRFIYADAEGAAP
jgi:pyruvate dehydrogenase E1 component alpha subunit